VTAHQVLFQVLIYVLPSSSGGRRSPIRSGYRCGFDLGVARDERVGRVDGDIHWLDADLVEPGASQEAWVRSGVAEHWRDVAPGLTVELFEGPHLVATGFVQDVLRRGEEGAPVDDNAIWGA